MGLGKAVVFTLMTSDMGVGMPQYLVVFVSFSQLNADDGAVALTDAINQHTQSGWSFISITPAQWSGAFVTFGALVQA